MYKLDDLQKAYATVFSNLIMVNFRSKYVIDTEANRMRGLKLEIDKEKACCRDIIMAINRHFKEGQYELAYKRMADLEESMQYIDSLEDRLKEQRRIGLFSLADKLNRRGWKAQVIQLNAYTTKQ